MASTPTRHRLRVDHVVRRCETFKVSYATKAEALDACEQQMAAGRVSPGCHLTPYCCARCGAWHMRNRVIVECPPDDPARRTWGGPRRKDPR